MTGCRFDFTVFLFHRPKTELKGFLSFTLLHSFGFNQPQRKQKTKQNNPINKEVTCWTLSQAPCCVFLNAPPTAPPLPLCSKCFGSNYLCLNSLHPHLKYQNTWRCFDCLLSLQDLINFFQTIFPFPPQNTQTFLGYVGVCSWRCLGSTRHCVLVNADSLFSFLYLERQQYSFSWHFSQGKKKSLSHK